MSHSAFLTLKLLVLRSCVQEESEPQRQQEEGQPEGPETSGPLDPPRRDGNEKHGKSPQRRPLWPRLANPVLPGPAAGCPQPIREPDRQQEQPLRYSHSPKSCCLIFTSPLALTSERLFPSKSAAVCLTAGGRTHTSANILSQWGKRHAAFVFPFSLMRKVLNVWMDALWFFQEQMATRRPAASPRWSAPWLPGEEHAAR